MRAPVNQPYRIGYRFLDPTFYGAKHAGIDYLIPSGTPIYACHNGHVRKAYTSKTLGEAIWLSGNDKETRYGHNTKLLVKNGQRVAEGQIIALAGSTGLSTAPHCHLELRINGKLVDPLKYIDQQGNNPLQLGDPNMTDQERQRLKNYEKFYAVWQAGTGKYPQDNPGVNINAELAHIQGIFEAQIKSGKSFAEADCGQWRQYTQEKVQQGTFKF